MILAGCTGGGTSTKHVPQASDSLYTEERAMAIYDTLPERALQILDSAEIVGNMPDYRAALFRAKVLSSSCVMMQQDSAIIICETLLRHDEAQRNVDFRQDVLELLLNASRRRYDYEEMVHWATELAELLRGQGLETEALRTDADLGLALTHIGQTDEGLAKIDNAIRQLGSTKKFNELDAWLIAVKRKITVLQEQGTQMEQVITLSDLMQQRLDDFAAHADDYHDGTYREPAKDDIPGYHDFYHAQATGNKAAAYAALGDRQAARREMDTFLRSSYGQTLDGRNSVAPMMAALGDYAAMLSTYDEVERRMLSEGDTLNGVYASILRGRAEAASASGHAVQAYDYLSRYEALESQLNDRLQRSKAHLYAARYHAQEQQLEIQQRKSEANRNLILAVGAIILALLAAGFAVYYFRQQRIIRKKNRVLVEQMTEAATLRFKSEKLKVKSEVQKGAHRCRLLAGQRIRHDSRLHQPLPSGVCQGTAHHQSRHDGRRHRLRLRLRHPPHLQPPLQGTLLHHPHRVPQPDCNATLSKRDCNATLSKRERLRVQSVISSGQIVISRGQIVFSRGQLV